MRDQPSNASFDAGVEVAIQYHEEKANAAEKAMSVAKSASTTLASDCAKVASTHRMHAADLRRLKTSYTELDPDWP
jgi:hypothetical protein